MIQTSLNTLHLEPNKDTEFFDSDRILVITTSNAMTRQIFFDRLRIL